MKKIGLFIIIFLNLLFVLGGEQDAVLKLKLSNNPGYYSGRMYCENVVDILIDSPNPTTAIQVYIDYNKSEIAPVPNRENNFRKPYPLLPSTSRPIILNLGNTGRLNITNNAFNIGQRRQGVNGIIGALRVINKTGVTNADLSFYVINFSSGQTAGDSTVSQAGGGYDLLSSVEDLSINFQTGPCLIDNSAPLLQNLNIADGAYRVNLQNITYGLDDVSNTGYHYEVNGGNYIPTTTKDNQYGVNINSLENILNGQNVLHNYRYNDIDSNISAIGETTREGKNRGYLVSISPFSRFSRNKEEEIGLIISGADNLGNGIKKQLSFNKPRAPFLRRAAKGDRDGNIGLQNPFFNQVPNKKPDSLYLVRENISNIKFAVVDDRAGVDSGSLNVTIRKGSIHGTIIKSYNYVDLELSGFDVTYKKNSILTGSTDVTHSNNFYVTLTGFGLLPASERIFVVVSGHDLGWNKTRFTNNNPDFPDQINYFSFVVKGTCESIQCREDILAINITGINKIYTGEKLYLSGNDFMSLSGNQLFCGKEYSGFDIISGVQSLKFYTGQKLVISGAGFTTRLSGNTLFVNPIKPSGQIIATPNIGVVPLSVNFTLSGIDYSWMTIQKIIFGDGIELIPTTGETSFSHIYSGAGIFSAKVELANKYDNNQTGGNQVSISVMGSCGNTIVESPEQCDGFNFSGQNCNNFGFNSGSLICNSCLISTQNCSIATPLTCGDGVRQGYEVCDINDFGGRGCLEYGYIGGYLSCTNSCTISTNNCTTNTIYNPPGGGGGGGTTLVKDNCPEGDYTISFYDSKCGTKPHGAATGIDIPPTRKCEIIKSPYGKELTDAFKRAYSRGITTMCPIEQANIKGLLLRKHMAKMISSFAIQVVGLNAKYYKRCEFKDISKETVEMKYYIKLSCQLGLMGLKYDGTDDIYFNPNMYVNRAQFGTILSRLIRGDKYNGNAANRYINHLKALQKIGIMNIIHTPQMKEVRGFVLIMLHRTFKSNVLHTSSLSRPVKEILDAFFSK